MILWEEHYSKQKPGQYVMKELLRELLRGETLLASLLSKLFADGRIEDAKLAAIDENARKLFYKEYGMTD